MRTNVKYKINYLVVMRNIFILLLCIIIVNMFLFPIIGSAKMATKTIVINTNDTLWKLASDTIKSSSNKNLTIGKVIYDIKQINNMEDSNIYEGDFLEMPIYE